MEFGLPHLPPLPKCLPHISGLASVDVRDDVCRIQTRLSFPNVFVAFKRGCRVQTYVSRPATAPQPFPVPHHAICDAATGGDANRRVLRSVRHFEMAGGAPAGPADSGGWGPLRLLGCDALCCHALRHAAFGELGSARCAIAWGGCCVEEWLAAHWQHPLTQVCVRKCGWMEAWLLRLLLLNSRDAARARCSQAQPVFDHAAAPVLKSRMHSGTSGVRCVRSRCRRFFYFCSSLTRFPSEGPPTSACFDAALAYQRN